MVKATAEYQSQNAVQAAAQPVSQPYGFSQAWTVAGLEDYTFPAGSHVQTEVQTSLSRGLMKISRFCHNTVGWIQFIDHHFILFLWRLHLSYPIMKKSTMVHRLQE